MHYLRTDRIIRRIEQIVEEGLGQYRAIASGTYKGDLPFGLSQDADLRRAIYSPRYNVEMPNWSRAPESPPSNGSILIYNFVVEIRLIRAIDRGNQLTPTSISAVKALAARDADVISQPLEYVRNLRFMADGLPTGMIGLKFSDSRTTIRGNINEGAQVIESLLTFNGKAVSMPEIDTGLELTNPQDNPEVGASLDLTGYTALVNAPTEED